MRPNVLILFSDQQRYDTIAAAGYKHMITPNLDKLVQEGTLYCNAHTANPVCMPARHDLITGFPARVHGYYSNACKRSIKDYSVPTLPRIMARNGYRTVAVGKMHFSPAREHHGFDEMYLMEELPEIRQQDEYAVYLEQEGLGQIQNLHGVRPHLYHTPQNSQMDEAHHGTTWVANRAIEWISKNDGEPFFMMCGFIQPHPPWSIPEELNGIYDGIELPIPAKRSRSEVDCTEPSEWFGDFDSPEQITKTRAAYYSAVTMVDKAVGKIIGYLRDTQQLDNTLIIYTSDHGEMLYDKGYFSKEVAYEGAVRVPLIVRYPKEAGCGEVRQDFVDLLDILPTCLDACNIAYPNYTLPLFGESLFAKNAVRNRSKIASATGEGFRRWVMVRNHKYKYIYNYNGGVEELYNTQDDPQEIENLMQAEYQLPSDYNELRSEAIAYELQWGPKGCIINNTFCSLRLEKFHPSVRGKFHFWSNGQMQAFFSKKDGGYRANRLLTEMEYAVSNKIKSTVGVNEVFSNSQWCDDFSKNFTDYTGQQIDVRKLFGK